MLIVNGSIRGAKGDSGRVVSIVERLANLLQNSPPIQVLTLTDPMPRIEDVKHILNSHGSFLIVTGNYWSSWGSPLQRFLEVVTAYENSEVFFGKPLACVVSMDSVGGMDIAARLHGAFQGLGCWSPPCSTVIISRVGMEAISASEGQDDDPNEDVWRPSDLAVLVKNLLVAETVDRRQWDKWPHVEFEMREGAWPGSGELDYGRKPFIES